MSSVIKGIEAVKWDELAESVVHQSIRRKTFRTDRVSLVRYSFASGSVFPMHSHSEAQITMVLSGTLTFDFGDRVEEFAEGAIVSIPGDVSHEGRAERGPVEIICIFSPPRA